jgi:DNA excision repair protein ERCC-6
MLEMDDSQLVNAASANIFISPPDDPNCSDEDSGEENGNGDYNNLSSKQLQADAVASVKTVDGNNIQIGLGNSFEKEDAPSPAKRMKRQTKKDSSTVRKWVKEDLPSENRHKAEDFAPLYENLDLGPASTFELFFDDEVIDMIVQQTKSYAMMKGRHNITITTDKIRLFLAILFTSGYAPLPRRRMYWEPSDDVQNVAISKSMPRNEFDDIMQFLHVADNHNLSTTDKVAKVRPLLSMINERFLRFFPKEAQLSIDESMLPYYGRHSMKQFIRGKPIRFGYKIWSLNTPEGYCIQFEPYQGAGVTDPNVGLGGSVVLDLISELPHAKYQLFFDNFFTSIRLLNRLSEQGIGATGTIRLNRVENCPLSSPEQMKKQARGTSDYRCDTNSGVLLVRWNDNSVVTVASNCYGVNPLGQAQRWSNAQKKQIVIPQPNLIQQYNGKMGGVDRMDQNISLYRISLRSKKWWWPFFAYCADVAMQNAWLIYRKSAANRWMPLDHLEFRRTVTRTYFARFTSDKVPISRPLGRPKRLNHRAPDDVRYDSKNHIVAPGATQRRCAWCSKKTTHICKKCNVGLHIRCFSGFHRK